MISLPPTYSPAEGIPISTPDAHLGSLCPLLSNKESSSTCLLSSLKSLHLFSHSFPSIIVSFSPPIWVFTWVLSIPSVCFEACSVTYLSFLASFSNTPIPFSKEMFLSLSQWFPNGDNLSSQGIFGNVWRYFGLSQLVGGRATVFNWLEARDADLRKHRADAQSKELPSLTCH